MRYTPAYPELPVHVLLDPRRLLRLVWVGRLVLASAILIAAAFVWSSADPGVTLVATLTFAGAFLATTISWIFADVYRRPTRVWFVIGQCLVDLLLVTSVVHVTGGWDSQFVGLYIIVIAVATLLLPARSGPIVAVAAASIYGADVLYFESASPHLGLAVQGVLFLVVGVGAEAIAARLRNDGSNRMQLAERLAKVQFEAADILRTIRSGIITVDERGHLLYANPAASDLLGLHLRGFIGRPVLRPLREISTELALLLERTARDGQRITRAEGFIRRDDTTLIIGVTTTAVDYDVANRGQTATAIFQDITDTKRVQALNIRAERLQAVAELSASLAHEIRNPLASIRSATEQLAQRAHASAQAEDDRILHNLVVREADRLDRLLGEFLDFARTRASRLRAIDVAELAHRTAAIVRAHPTCVDGVDVAVSAAPGLNIDGDEDLLHRAILNLLLNAVQAVAPSGKVSVQASWHTGALPSSLAAYTGTRVLRIVVEDNGPGIPAEVRERMFEPFVSGRVGGSGLGLPMVHRAVESHYGEIFVEHLDMGTRFTILLPSTMIAPSEGSDATDTLPEVGQLYGDTSATDSSSPNASHSTPRSLVSR